MTTHIT